MRYTHYILFALFVFSATGLAAQRYEIGLKTSTLRDFDVLLKKQTKDGDFLRLRLFTSQILFQAGNERDRLTANFRLALGKEKRVSLSDRFQFLHGWSPGIGVSYTTTLNVNLLTVNPFVGYILGVQYGFSPTFAVGLEAIPSAGIFVTSGTGGVSSLGARLNASDSNVAIFAVARFERNKK